MQHLLFGLCACVLLPGCADIFLKQSIRNVEKENIELGNYDKVEQLGIDGAVKLAFDMADGYADAARDTAVAQDVASAGLILAAGSAVVGIAEGVADEVVAERVVNAVAVERFLGRGVPEAAIVALLDGASRHNCVAMTGRRYSRVDLETLEDNGGNNSDVIEENFAAFLMVLVMREIEYRTFAGLSRDLESFGTLVSAFNNAVATAQEPGQPVDPPAGARKSGAQPTVVGLTQNAALERFFGVLKGCLASPADGAPITPDTNAS